MTVAIPERLVSFQNTSFGGVPCAQHWTDFLLWEMLLNEYPVEGIVEIGTWRGGFSRYLNAQAEARGLWFITYDSIVPEDPPPGFLRRDVFIEKEQVAAVIDGATIALLVDGGNKPREARLFGPYLEPGSLMVCHDWRTAMPEWTIDDDTWARRNGFEVVLEEQADQLGSAARWYRKL